MTTRDLPLTAAIWQLHYSSQQVCTFNGSMSPSGLVSQRFLMNQSLAGKPKFIKPPNVLSETSPLWKRSHWGFFLSIQLHLSFISIQPWEAPDLDWCFPGCWVGRSNLNRYYFLPSSQGEPVVQDTGQTRVSCSHRTLVRAGDWKGHIWVWYELSSV